MPDAVKLTLRQKRANRVLDRLYRKIDKMNVLPKSLRRRLLPTPGTVKRSSEITFSNCVFSQTRMAWNGKSGQCRNYLFVGNERGGETAAILLSLIATCKANKINPFEFLKDVLSRINSHPHRKLAELLSLNWKQYQKLLFSKQPRYGFAGTLLKKKV
jgi:hypothetical protein